MKNYNKFLFVFAALLFVNGQLSAALSELGRECFKKERRFKQKTRESVSPTEELFGIVSGYIKPDSTKTLKNQIDELIQNGADIHATDEDGRTPLHYVCYYFDKELIRLFLEHDADPNKTDKFGENVIHCLCIGGAKSGAIIKIADAQYIVALLVGKGVDLNLPNEKGFYPLDYFYKSKVLIDCYCEEMEPFNPKYGYLMSERPDIQMGKPCESVKGALKKFGAKNSWDE